MSKLDVLFLVRSLHTGGAERQLVVLAQTLHERGIRVGVAQFYGGGVFSDELLRAGLPVYDLLKAGRWSNFGFLWRLLVLICKLRPKVVHGYLSGPNLVLLLIKPLLRRQGTSVVCGVRASAFDLNMYDSVTAYIETFHRWALRFSDAVILNSEAALLHFSRGSTSASKFYVIDNGIDADKYLYTDEGRRGVRELWGVAEREPLIGLVGRHDPVKDHALFLSAAAIVANQIPDAKFVIVGSEVTTITPDLKIQAEVLGISERLVWAGERSDMPAVYSAIDILCLCSHSEGFPNVVAEAMSCGLPCVCSDVGDVRRLVGDVGSVIEGRNSADLAKAIQQAILGLPSWDREKPRRRIVNYFGVEKLADTTLAVLSKFLK